MINKVMQQNPYAAMVEGYGAFNTSSKVRGTLIEKNDNEVKIDIGNNKIMQATLKNKIDAQIGDMVVIDKKDIIKSKTTTASEVVEKDEKAQYEEVLNRLDVKVNEENIKAAKTLQSHGIQITKENIQSFVFSKNYLDDIVGNLDYDSAIKLLEKDIDLENDSLQTIALALEEIKNEKEGFSFSKLFKKKEINTEEAEEIAQKIYGSKMGKDITDIIKALYKRDVSITKNNIERVNDVFYKLDKLQELEDQTLIDTVKNKIEASIDNLYKIKSFVKKGVVEAGDKISAWTTKIYENFVPKAGKITEKELKMLEEDIKSLLKSMGLEPTEENVKLAKDLIRNNVDMTKENIESIQEMKKALKDLIENLDHDKAAALIKSGINIEKEDIREVVKQLIKIESIKTDVKVEDKEIQDLLQKIEDFKKIEEKDLLILLKKNVNFEINKIEQVILKKNMDILSLQKGNQSTQILDISISKVSRLTNVFNTMKELDFNTVAFQMRNNIPMTLRNLGNSHLWINKKIEKPDIQPPIEKVERPKQLTIDHENTIKKYVRENMQEISRGMQSAKSLIQNGLHLSKVNIQRVYEAYGYYKNIKDNLSTNMVVDSVQKGLDIENMDLKDVSRYVNQFKENMEKIKAEYDLKHFTKDIGQISKERESAIALLMKGNKPLSLREIQKNASLLKNKDQIGHKIDSMMDFLERSEDENNKESANVLKMVSKRISKSLKEGNINPEKAYEEMMNAAKEVKNAVKMQDEDGSKTFHKKYKELLDTLEQSYRLNKEEKILQFPLYMNEQFTNLNMFFRDRQKGNKKMDAEDMSVVLSLETKNMGNVNIHLGVEKNQVKVQMDVDNPDDKAHIEKYKEILEGLLGNIGYELEDISFDVEQEQNVMTMGENPIDKYVSKSFLDLKI